MGLHANAPGRAGELAAVLGASLTRTLTELVIFGYVPLYLYASGERRITQLALVTALPALVRFVAANAWGALVDVTGRPERVLLVGIAGYWLASVGLLQVSTGLQAMMVVSLTAALFAALSPAGKALVSLVGETAGRAAPGAAATSRDGRPAAYRPLAWWLQLESWGWLLGSAAVAARGRLGLSPQGLLLVVAGVVTAQGVWAGLALRGLPGGRKACAARSWIATFRGRLAGMVADWRRLYGRGTMALLFAVFGLSALAAEASFTVFGFYFTGVLGGSESGYGVTVAASTGLGLLVYAVMGRPGVRLAPGPLMVTGAVLYGVTYAVMAAAPGALTAAIAFGLPVYALLRIGATWSAGALTRADERGGGMGGLDGAEALATALGALAAGLVADGWGLRAVYWAAAGVAALLAGLAWQLKRRLEERCTAALPDRAAVPPGRTGRRAVPPVVPISNANRLGQMK
ncbi:MAG: hypothetical protein IMX02_03090 [Limnochordaceae bacterium]|nr:hypothetical protein [Limnochordaceae bacterium]